MAANCLFCPRVVHLMLVALATLTLSLAACGEDEVRGFTPGNESLDRQAPGVRSEPGSPDRRQPNAVPDREPVRPPTTMPAPPSIEKPSERVAPTVSASPTPDPDPTPTPAPAPIELTLTLADDQTSSSSPTATWVAGNPSRVARYEMALGAAPRCWTGRTWQPPPVTGQRPALTG